MDNLRRFSAEFTLRNGQPIDLSQQQLEQFAIYQRLLIDWNSRINLTRIIEPDDIVIRHFLDSLTCATITGDLNQQTLIDVGTGAGFPGLPLKILFPEMRLTLADSVAKKTKFLQAVVDELSLPNVKIVADRAEALGQASQHREQYDWAVARAVARLPILAEYLLPLVNVGGNMLAQKGGTVVEESAESTNAIQLLGGASAQITPIQLPQREEKHYLVTIEKVKNSPAQYPRRAGKPSKKPL